MRYYNGRTYRENFSICKIVLKEEEIAVSKKRVAKERKAKYIPEEKSIPEKKKVNKGAEQNFKGLKIDLVEGTTNSLATKYIEENFDEIYRKVPHMDSALDKDMIIDLINDVWKSLKEDENDGKGYRYGYSENNELFTVEMFVYGRLKGYSKNKRYRKDRYSEIENDPEKDGEIPASSSSSGERNGNLNDFQKAYMQAPLYDDLGSVEDTVSLRSNIELCRQFEEEAGIKIVTLLKNIDSIAEKLDKCDSSIFTKLKGIMNRNAELKNAFLEIINVAMNSKEVYNKVLASI